MSNLDLVTTLLLLPGILVGFTVHEFAHAFMAVKMGDDTPILEKRYTLNPIRHIDLMGLILVIIAHFGWAKPVHFNPNNLKNPRWDEILISLAGPLANLLVSIVIAILLKLLIVGQILEPRGIISALFLSIIYVNLMLMIFNLIPIPPLDGSHVILVFIPDRFYNLKHNLLQYGSFILLALILIDNFSGINVLPIGTLIDGSYNMLVKGFGL